MQSWNELLWVQTSPCGAGGFDFYRAYEGCRQQIGGSTVGGWNVSVEIGVVGDTLLFTDSGDCGSLCFMEDELGIKAAGLVIGMNSRYHLAVVTPVWAVVEDIETKLGETVTFTLKNQLNEGHKLLVYPAILTNKMLCGDVLHISKKKKKQKK